MTKYFYSSRIPRTGIQIKNKFLFIYIFRYSKIQILVVLVQISVDYVKINVCVPNIQTCNKMLTKCKRITTFTNFFISFFKHIYYFRPLYISNVYCVIRVMSRFHIMSKLYRFLAQLD